MLKFAMPSTKNIRQGLMFAAIGKAMSLVIIAGLSG